MLVPEVLARASCAVTAGIGSAAGGEVVGALDGSLDDACGAATEVAAAVEFELPS